MNPNPIHVIGIGQGKKDLTRAHLDIISKCDVLTGGKRHLALFPEKAGEHIVIGGRINDLVQRIKEERTQKKIVVLASGDPMFYGIGTTLCKRLGPENVIVHPNVSAIAAAFARIKIPWHNAKIISLHGKQETEFSFSGLAQEDKVAFLTDPVRGPNFIAEKLAKENLHGFRLCVLENLGDEKKQTVSWFETPGLLRGRSFDDPNIVILLKQETPVKKEPRETHIGMPDSLFRHENGLITKSEIRSVSLSKLKLFHHAHLLWDIGSGSGSVGIEASFLIPRGHVYAIEKNKKRIPDIAHNISTFGCTNVTVLNTAFPEGTDVLPPPDRIFIGGGGKRLEIILKTACQRLERSGIIVINTVLLQNLETAVGLLKQLNFDPEAVQLQVSKSTRMPYGDRFDALNPVWIVSGTKPDERT